MLKSIYLNENELNTGKISRLFWDEFSFVDVLDEIYPLDEFFEGNCLSEENYFFIVLVFNVQSLSFPHLTHSYIDESYYLSFCLLSTFGVEVPVLDFPLSHRLILTLKVQITFLLFYLQSVLLHIKYFGFIEEKSLLFKHDPFHISPFDVVDAADIFRHDFAFRLGYFRAIFLFDL